MAPTPNLEKRLKALHFEKLSLLGHGHFSEVSLYRYHGYHKSIKVLCDDKRRIVIKLFNTTDNQHEIAIGETLTHHVAQRPTEDALLFHLSVPLKDDNGLIGLLSRYDTFKVPDTKGGTLEHTSSLESFLANLFTPKHTTLYNITLQPLIMPHLAIFLCQIACGMKVAQNQLHAYRLLHLDTATRNFLIKLNYNTQGELMQIIPKLNDYGQSLQLKHNQNDIISVAEKFALKWLDIQFLTTQKKATILTDLFALKASIIGMLGLIVTPARRETDCLYLIEKTDDNMKFYHERVQHFKDDNLALKTFLQHVKNRTRAHTNPVIQQALLNFISVFEPYLTRMPLSDNFETAKLEDWILFKNTTEKFIQNALMTAKDNYVQAPDAEHLPSTLQRILKIGSLHHEFNISALQCIDKLLFSIDQEISPSQNLPQGENYYG